MSRRSDYVGSAAGAVIAEHEALIRLSRELREVRSEAVHQHFRNGHPSNGPLCLGRKQARGTGERLQLLGDVKGRGLHLTALVAMPHEAEPMSPQPEHFTLPQARPRRHQDHGPQVFGHRVG
jgi:hypothetical protein